MLTRIAGVVWLALGVLALAPASAQERPGRGAATEAAQAWEVIDSNDAKELETFIKYFGDTFYGDLARVKLERLAKAAETRARARGIEGMYDARGTNPNGTTYRGEATITAEGNRYHFHWRIGSQTFQGSGILKGATIAVDWGQKYPAVYKLGGDGVLRGRWHNGRATDDLFPRVSAVPR